VITDETGSTYEHVIEVIFNRSILKEERIKKGYVRYDEISIDEWGKYLK
jgi:hypothetical protein